MMCPQSHLFHVLQAQKQVAFGTRMVLIVLKSNAIAVDSVGCYTYWRGNDWKQLKKWFNEFRLRQQLNRLAA